MAILSKWCKPDNFESHNFLKLSFTNITGLHLNFLECESFLESNSLDILALCVTNLDKSTDSGIFSEIGYLPLMRKKSILICMVLQLIWKKDLLLHGTYLYKTLLILTYVSDWLYFIQCLTSFSSINQLLCFYACFLIPGFKIQPSSAQVYLESQ